MAYTTRASLLRGIHENNEDSWREFLRTYHPFIVFLGTRLGLKGQELEDLEPEVMLALMKNFGNYDHTLGKFRAYLQGIIRHCANSIKRRRIPNAVHDICEDAPDEKDIQAQIDAEYEKILMKTALDEFREESDELQFLAFEMYVLQERDAQEVAEILKISINQVYLAKSRGVARLRFLIERLKRDQT